MDCYIIPLCPLFQNIKTGKTSSYAMILFQTNKQKEAFAPILMTLRALAADDERIIEYFRSIAEGKQHSKGNIHIDIPDGLNIDVDEFTKSIKLQFWSKLAKLSWRPFEEAREFVHALKLISRESKRGWKNYCAGKIKGLPKKPDDIPYTPGRTYSDQWKGLGDWLGTKTKPKRKKV